MPTVLKMARQMNHASWWLRALFHMPIVFQTPSQSASRMRKGIKTPSQAGKWFALISTRLARAGSAARSKALLFSSRKIGTGPGAFAFAGVLGQGLRMKPHDSWPESACSAAPTTRRHFLQQAASVAAGAAVFSELNPQALAGASADPPRLPVIKLGKHEVTRLILGGNPIYGFSHFNHLLSQYQTDWHTPERVFELLQHAEGQGINTWQNSYAERTLADLARYRSAGGKMQWLCLSKPDWDQNPQLVEETAKRGPIGIAPHGALGERLHRQNKLGVLTDLLKRIRDSGVLVGLSAHNPALIELAEEKGWDVDYYMCCLYYLTRPREEFQKLLGGELPVGEIYLSSDPARMFKVIRTTRKPCLAYKVLAAGRRIEGPAQVRQCFETAFNNIKPTDAVIVGMYQQLNNQVGENCSIVRELCSRKA